jgi:hypothetical protein
VGGQVLGWQRPTDHRLRRIPPQKSNSETVEWFIVGLAAQQNYISICVNATDGTLYLTEKYADKLGKVPTGKSSISFDTIDNIDLDQLSGLVTDAKRLIT